VLNIHDAALAALNHPLSNSAALSASQAGQSKYIRQRKRKTGSSNRSALEQQAAAPRSKESSPDADDAITVIHDNNSCAPARGDASLDVAKYLPSNPLMT
jgi:hypothetical protein